MKQIYFIIILLILNIIPLSSKPDSTYWIDKGEYKEINVKIGKVSFLKFSNDGKSLFTYGQDSILRKWDIENGVVSNENFINSNPRINFNLSADEEKFGYLSVIGDNYNKFIRFDIFNLKNEFIQSFCATGRNYKNPCPYSYVINNKGISAFLFHPFQNSVICETDFEIDCPTDDLYFEHYFGGSFEFFSADSSGQYLFTSHPGSKKGSLTFSPNGNYTVYESISIKHTYDMKEDRSIDNQYYNEVIADQNFNPITILYSYVSNNRNLYTLSKYYVFSADSKLLTFKGHNFAIYKVPTGVILSNWSTKDMKIDLPEAIAFTKDNKNLVTGSNVNGISSIRFWDISKKELVNYYDFPVKDMGWKFAVNKDSGYLITASNDGIIRIFKNSSFQTLKVDYYADSIDFYTNEDVAYHDNSTGAIKSRLWDFGDNTTSTEQDPIHRFKASGSYIVKLKVSNGIKTDSLKKIYKVYDRIPNNLPDDKNIIIRRYLEITPNPATDYIDIIVPRWRGQGVDLSIYDILGMKITTPSLRDAPPYQGGEIVRIDVSGLAPGVYFVRIGDIVSKFIKL